MKPRSHIKSVYSSLLFLAGAVAVHAAQFGDFTYEASGTQITITKYTGPGGDVTIPDTIAGLPVTSIRDVAFLRCTGLTGILIGNSVASIGQSAFYGCSGLSSVSVGNSVTNIAYTAFSGCTGLLSINVNAPNTAYSSLDGVLFNKNQDTLMLYPCGKGGSYSVPDGVNRIEGGAFVGCSSLTSVILPDSVVAVESV